MNEVEFFEFLAQKENATVLELGTKRSIPDRPFHPLVTSIAVEPTCGRRRSTDAVT